MSSNPYPDVHVRLLTPEEGGLSQRLLLWHKDFAPELVFGCGTSVPVDFVNAEDDPVAPGEESFGQVRILDQKHKPLFEAGAPFTLKWKDQKIGTGLVK